MGKKRRGQHEIPPGVLDEIITRLTALEEWRAAVEGATNAAVVVYATHRLPDQPDKPGGDA